ncbi:phage tail tube protein [Bradyrhizobium sp. 63_E2_N1_3]|uniref:phage tail tube protein n=1 Tax=Bradyrhizobium sp. 63_E2_N1_3 TaxID=3240373 RepID=UPI003F8A40B1
MAAIQKIRGTQLFIKVGDGASPEVFAHPCLINTKRGIQFQSSTNKIITPDCDNPDDPAWTEAIKDSLGATINGAGTLDVASVSSYDAWFRSPDSKSVQVWLAALGHWGGFYHLTNFEITGDRGALAEASITLESDGIIPAFIPAP